MIGESKRQKFQAFLLSKVRGPQRGTLLGDADFHYCVQCERMRIDRNGSVLSLLLIRLPGVVPGSSAHHRFTHLLERRLRATDTPGMVHDGRIGVLLPDTSAEGAWKLASDLSEYFPPGPGRPQCEVVVYPESLHGESVDPDAVCDLRPAQADGTTEGNGLFCYRVPLSKRLLDVSGAVAGLVLTSPLLLAAAAAIKLTSPGPILFAQEREGRGGRRFKMYKLRTMHKDADSFKALLRDLSQQDGPAFKMRRDPRTTAVGRLLRWLSVDELPQFWNVLRGDMSLVGPRPLPTDESQACESWQRRRLTVNPGMTGVWQVFGRGRVSFDEWVRMDLRYVRRQSLVHDVALVAVTLPALIFHKGMR